MGVLLIVLGLMFQGNWSADKAYTSCHHWALAAVIQGIGFELIAFRNILSPIISVVGANTIIVVSAAIVHRGIVLFVGEQPNDSWYWAVTIWLSCYPLLVCGINRRRQG
ncbi:MAG: hypothetical protein WCJ64_17460, partial [Rhodospirillaceae bacterium]